MRAALRNRFHQFFGTPPTPCPYLPERDERKIVTEIAGPDADLLYEALTEAGFRRAQSLAYKPACDDCEACTSVRVCVTSFQPSRSLRRISRRNGDLRTLEQLPLATRENFDLFQRYLENRHADGGMTDMGFADYRAMIEDTPVDSVVVEFRDPSGELCAVSLSDRLSDGYSMVYSFFDPLASARSLGTFMVLWHIDQTRALRLPYVYLGYWIADCHKMAYKTRFSPLEGLGTDGWRELSRSELGVS